MQTALLLIAFGFGFKIFAEATANVKKTLKRFGRIVGIIMMVVSLCGVICTVWTSAACGVACYRSGSCSFHGQFQKSYGAKKSMDPFCPFMKKGPAEQGTSGN